MKADLPLHDSHTMASNPLSRAEVLAYHREGYTSPVPAIDAGHAQEIVGRLQRFEAETGLPPAEVICHKGHLKLMALYELVFQEKILDAVESILGPNILCWGSSLLVKPAGDPAFVAWHQDSAYWGLDPADVCSVGLALTASTSENGAMRVIPCSHQGELMALPHRLSDDDSANTLFSGEEIAVEVNDEEAVELVLAQGEMSLHHVKIIHDSQPNRAKTARIMYWIRYVAPHVQPPEPLYHATLVRGDGPYGYFEPDPVPTGDMEPEIVSFVDSPQTRPLGAAKRR